MPSPRAQLRIVALFYAAVLALGLFALATINSTGASTPSGLITQEPAKHAKDAIPLAAVTAFLYLGLSVLSFRFLALSRVWRIAAIAGSLGVSLSQAATSVRDTLIVTPTLLNLGPDSYGILAVELSVFWGRALAFSLCSYVLWRQFTGEHTSSSTA
jgi:hypothetical protein